MGTDDFADRPLLLLGGTLCTDAVFDGLLDALKVPSARRQYVTLGRPSISDYDKVFEDLPGDTIVCGFSLGAIVAAHFADRMVADRLILFGLNPFADDPTKAPSRYDLARDVTTLGGAAAMTARAPEVFGQAADQIRATIYQMADEAADLIAPQTRLALTRPGAVPALARAQMPVLALTGSLDQSAPPGYGMAAAQAAPLGQFVALEGLGHFALLEDPDACAAAVVPFLKADHDPK